MDLSNLSEADLISLYQKMKGAAESPKEPALGGHIKAAAQGLGEGGVGLLGLPGDVANLASMGIAKATKYVGSKLGFEAPDYDPARDKILPGSADIMKAAVGEDAVPYQPKTTGEKYTRTIASFAPGGAMGRGGALARVGGQILAPGAASEAAGQATEGTAAEPYARIGAALAAPAGVGAVRRTITPFPASPERQAMVQALRNEGVDSITAGQQTGRMPLRWAEGAAADTPFASGRAEEIRDTASRQFTAAALRRTGTQADSATPQVINQAFDRIGQQFDDLAGRNNLQYDRQLVQDLTDTAGNYVNMVPQAAPVVENTVRHVFQRLQANNGTIQGAEYQALSSRLARDARNTKDPELRTALMGIRESLDDAMERTLQASNPADLGAWREARNQYRNLLVIEKAATGAGERAALGEITPSQLRNATVNQSRRNYARGEGDFAELARAGEAILKPLPSSGTAQRAFFMGLPAMMGIGGSAAGGPLAGAASAAGTVAAGGAMSRALLSNPVQGYLANQALPPPGPARDRLIDAMLRASPAWRDRPQ